MAGDVLQDAWLLQAAPEVRGHYHLHNTLRQGSCFLSLYVHLGTCWLADVVMLGVAVIAGPSMARVNSHAYSTV